MKILQLIPNSIRFHYMAIVESYFIMRDIKKKLNPYKRTDRKVYALLFTTKYTR